MRMRTRPGLGLKVTNTGSARGAETLLAYWAPLNRTNPGGAGLLPLQRRLFGFAKTHELAPGASQLLNISRCLAPAPNCDCARARGVVALVLRLQLQYCQRRILETCSFLR